MNFNFEIISLIVCATSFISLSIFVYRKVPVLSGLPEREIFPVKRIRNEVREKLKITFKERLHNLEIALQKNLQRSRVLFLRADNKAMSLIKKLRERSDKRRIELEDHWKDMKITIPIKKSKKKAE